MLKLQGISQDEMKSYLETDFYVPITVEFPLNDISSKELFYYRVLNNKSSFIEVKVNSESNKIFSITVVSINDIEYSSKELTNVSDIPKSVGNPIIDVDIWNGKKIIDSKDDFKVMYGDNKLFLLLERIEQITQRLVLPNIELLLNKGDEIVGYIFYDIPVDKRKDLEEGIVASTNKTSFTTLNRSEGLPRPE
ncbi:MULTISPECIES: hypothetical protein [Paenibacillus]|uniref:hypothetical protein n=1 Tax=Paenibacillus TaxID=44249 RepID=UPI0011A5E763|nr:MULTISPECIES: hypothetical protein [Paenibacillus]MCM3171283.1 hypothetical protein [Paenibacillus sp. MER 99-2]